MYMIKYLITCQYSHCHSICYIFSIPWWSYFLWQQTKSKYRNSYHHSSVQNYFIMDLNYTILTNIFIFLKKVCSNIFSIRPKLDNKKYIYFAIWINNIWKKKTCRNIDILESFYYTFICVSIREGKTEYMCAHEILFHWLKFTKLISNKWK